MERPRLMEPVEGTDEEEYSDEDEKESSYEDDEVKIPFEFDNVSTLDAKGRFSPEIEVEGVPWRAKVVKKNHRNGEEYLYAYLYSMQNKSVLWSIDLHYTIVLVNADSSKDVAGIGYRYTFKYDETNWGAKFVKWSELIDEKNGFLNDDKITVQIHFLIIKMIGIRIAPSLFDFMKPDRDGQDVALVIGGAKIYADRKILALYSPIFNSMFYSNFSEKNKDEIELKDIDREEFIELLNFLYPSDKKITDANAELLLELSDRFQIKKLIDQVEQYLIGSSKFDGPAKLNLSEQYRLPKLQEHCMGKSKSTEDISDPLWTIDFLDPNEPRHDLTLVVNGENIYVSKQYLSIHSEWLHRELKKRNELKIDVDDREEFMEMLRVIYPSYGKITDGNVVFLLKLADRFEIKLLFDLAEDFLISSTDPSLASKLLLSDKYKLIKLQDHIFSGLRLWTKAKKIKDAPEYKQLSDKTARALLEKMVLLMERQAMG